MSWIEKLYETYDNCLDEIGVTNKNNSIPLLPICHTSQNAHINIVLNGEGDFLRASIIPKKEAPTILPSTEGASGRTGSSIAPLSLGDKLQYIAGDYIKYGGNKKPGFEKYTNRLKNWVSSGYTTDQLNAVYKYVMKGHIIEDLINHDILYYDKDTITFPAEWKGDKKKIPKILSLIKVPQLECLIRFTVEIELIDCSNLWENPDIWDSWISYYLANKEKEDKNDTKKIKPTGQNICMVSGELKTFINKHPSKIRHSGDGAKLISSNDTIGYTYRGRFKTAIEACTIGYDVSLKAHNALRWLIARQGYREGDIAIVAWATKNVKIFNPFLNTTKIFGGEPTDNETVIDTAEYTGRSLRDRIRGYSSKLGPTDKVVIMGIDSATKGCMALIYYRELNGSDFLEKVEAWHTNCAWLQNYSKELKFIGAPSPTDIVKTTYGQDIKDNFKGALIRRILPCIIDGTQIPSDIVNSIIRKVSNREVMKPWEWDKALGIACAVYKYYYKERKYKMALETDRTTRDYLYGRLLAVADSIEGFALSQSGEKRPTNAARLIQRFANHPCSTWRTIELAIAPSKERLGGKIKKFNEELKNIMDSFNTEDFIDDTALTGEFLLGYHTERSELIKSKNDRKGEENETIKED